MITQSSTPLEIYNECTTYDTLFEQRHLKNVEKLINCIYTYKSNHSDDFSTLDEAFIAHRNLTLRGRRRGPRRQSQSVPLLSISQNPSIYVLTDRKEELITDQIKWIIDNNTIEGMIIAFNLQWQWDNSDIEEKSHNFVYLAHIGTVDNYYYFKYGESRNLEDRLATHRKNFKTFTIIQILVCTNSRKVEQKFGKFLEQEGSKCTYLNKKDKIETEVFKVNSEKTLVSHLQQFRILQQEEEDSPIVVDLKKKLEESDKEKELMRKDLEILQLKFERLK
jgi:hypothetical protein